MSAPERLGDIAARYLATLPRERSIEVIENELHHYVCPCDDDTALCGTDVSDAIWMPSGTLGTCPMCPEVTVCPKCGAAQ